MQSRFDEPQQGGGISPLLHTWADSDCDCSSEPLDPWQQPLLTARKGYRGDRLGALQGQWVDGVLHLDPASAAAALQRSSSSGLDSDGLLRGPSHGASRMGIERNDGYRADCVELLIDGARLIEATPGHWVEAGTGKPWRKRPGRRAPQLEAVR